MLPGPTTTNERGAPISITFDLLPTLRRNANLPTGRWARDSESEARTKKDRQKTCSHTCGGSLLPCRHRQRTSRSGGKEENASIRAQRLQGLNS